MWCRNSSQLAAPATTAAVTPTSRTATRPASAPTGPTEASRPAPSGPPENLAPNPMITPASDPLRSPHSGAASRNGVGAIRTVSSPASTPARYGAASTKKPSQGGNAARVPTGSAASAGNAGTAPRADPDGETAVPRPNENPGPSMYAIAQMTEFGRYASPASSSSADPPAPGDRESIASR